MSKPLIYFKGARFVTNGIEGYRPQLEKATKKTDLMLAEEVVLARRLSMSPEELLHAIRSTLEYCPTAVATDGIVREFTSLLCFNRTASGRVDGPGGSWNDTCSAKVKVQLLKDTKATIDGRFVNVNSVPTPKLDNVTYIGAVTAVNCVKINQQFAAYGRNLKFDATLGDKAWFIHPTTMQPVYCTCTSSDVSHAVFSWPSGFAPTVGSRCEFYMSSRNGQSGEGATTNMKMVVVLQADVPKIHVTVSEFVHDRDNMSVTGQHFEGLQGFEEQVGGMYGVPCRLYKNGTIVGQYTMRSNDATHWGFMSSEIDVFQSGDVAKVEFTVDSGKPEYEQEEVSKTYTVP